MKIAATYENGQIFQHFGRTEQFKIYTVEDGRVCDSEVYTADSGLHCSLADVLTTLGVTKLVCGGIGAVAKNAVAAAGIELFAGVEGSADEQIAALLRDNLMYDPDAQCDCHEHDDCDHEHHH